MKTKNSIKEKFSTPESVTLISDWLDGNDGSTRTQLARYMCGRLGLCDGKGALRIGTALKALRDLESAGYWKLPAAGSNASGKWNPRRLGREVPAPQGVPGRVDLLEGLELIEVRSGDDEHMRIWNELILTEHPLHECRMVGRQLRYLIASPHGWLGAIGFGSCALVLQRRDEWVGWNASQRAEHLERVVNMTRYLIRESAQCENLASHVLGLCARRVPKDFTERYGVEPWLLETFVDREHYAGTCFQAANWVCVGQSKGRGRNGSHKPGKSIKDIYIYPLAADFRARMGLSAPAAVEPLALESGLEAEQWAQHEFGGCKLGHTRRTEQMVNVAANKGRHPGGSYTRACGGNRHDYKGYSRLVNNKSEDVSGSSMIGGHRQQTIKRMAAEKTALIVQDTMDMNFSSRPHCDGLGPIGGNQTGTVSLGLKMHSSLVLNEQGLPLGVLGAQIYAAAPKKKGAGRRNAIPIEEKDSRRWLDGCEDAHDISRQLPNVHIVCIGDRESDIFELFDRHRRRGGSMDILVRAQHNRCLKDQEKKLFEHMAQGDPDGSVSISVPRQRRKERKDRRPACSGLPARVAEVEVRFREITICAPRTPLLRDRKPIALSVVYLFEKNPPPGATRIKWMLLTTMPVQSLKQAMKCVRWYCQRWRIEEWHRVLKSGCRVLEHQNQSRESLERTITIDVVVAWRIMLLVLLGRETPDLSCELFFNSWECEILQLLAQKKRLRSPRQSS